MNQFLYWLNRHEGDLMVNIAQTRRALAELLKQDDALEQLSKPDKSGLTALQYAISNDGEIADKLITLGVPVDIYAPVPANPYHSPSSILDAILTSDDARIMRSIIKRGIVFDPPFPLPAKFYGDTMEILDYYTEEYRVYFFLAALSQMAVSRSPLHDRHLWRTVAKYCCVPHRARNYVLE